MQFDAYHRPRSPEQRREVPMESRDDLKCAPVKTRVSVFDPIEEIAKLVTDGKISAPEADRIRHDFSSGRMTNEHVYDYVRQKTR